MSKPTRYQDMISWEAGAKAEGDIGPRDVLFSIRQSTNHEHGFGDRETGESRDSVVLRFRLLSRAAIANELFLRRMMQRQAKTQTRVVC